MFVEDLNKRVKFNSYNTPIHELYECDNLDGLNYLKTKGEKIDVIITDPVYGGRSHGRDEAHLTYEDILIDAEYLKFLEDRFRLCHEVLNTSGLMMVIIPDDYLFEIGQILNNIFKNVNFLGMFTYKKGGGNNKARHIKKDVEYILCFAKSKSACPNFAKVKNTDITAFLEDEEGKYRWRNTTSTLNKYNKKNDFVYVTKDGIFFYPGGDKKSFELRKDLTLREIKNRGIGRSFRYTKERLFYEEMNDNLLIKTDKHGNEVLYIREAIKEEKVVSSIIHQRGMNNSKSHHEINEILEDAYFSYPKPKELIHFLIFLSNRSNATFLDIFGGSGVLGRCILELNAGKTKYSKNKKLNNKFIIFQNDENNICESITYQVLKKTIEGYVKSNKKSDKLIVNNIKGVGGTGGNLCYFKYH